jgi:DNA repair exonuclease SbcCD nuclease subunit
MKYPYLLSSDQHCHGWSLFAGTTPEGLNSRLAAILNEMKLGHAALKSQGGNLSVYAGDLFHVRGKIEPSVFNPTFDTIKGLHEADKDLVALAIPGNHDLEGRDASKLGNAMQQLDTIRGFNVATEPTRHGDVIVFPWYADLNDLRSALKAWAEDFAPAQRAKVDVVIHAPVNGVIKGIPDHGLEAQELADLGFRRVFAGHYHNHQSFCDGKVFSIGASAHQTWSDPGTLAGFLLVYEDRVEHFESSAPKFMDLHSANVEIGNEAELEMVVRGNYVRLKVEEATEAEIKQMRADLAEAGALGAVVIAANTKTKTVSRTNTTVNASTTLEASVAEYVQKQLKPADLPEVQALCAELIAQAREEA